MSTDLVFRRVAYLEFQHATEWYESQRPMLGDEFISEMQLVLSNISGHPLQYPIVDDDVRGALLSRFPYCIYFRIKPSRITIIAVFHTSRDPINWQHRK